MRGMLCITSLASKALDNGMVVGNTQSHCVFEWSNAIDYIMFICTYLVAHVSDMYMWQSRVDIEGYSIAYFDCIAVFEATPIAELLLRAGLICSL